MWCGRLLRKTLIVQLCILLLTGCASQQIKWDEMFMVQFDPDEAMQRSLENSVQNHGDATVRLTQTLGNKKTVYLAVNITIPGISSKNANIDQQINPERIYLFSGILTEDEIKDLPIDVIRGNNSNNIFSARTTSHFQALKDDTLSYVFCIDVKNDKKIENDVTLLISGLAYTDSNGENTITRDKFLISWNADNNGELLAYEIYNNGEKQGDIFLSNFALQIELYFSEYKSFDDLLKDITIRDTQGNLLGSDHSVGGSVSSGNGKVTIYYHFRKLISPEKVGSIQIGDILVKTNHN